MDREPGPSRLREVRDDCPGDLRHNNDRHGNDRHGNGRHMTATQHTPVFSYGT
jgi:hypothetical protein